MKITVKKYAEGEHPEEYKNFKGNLSVQGNFRWEGKYSGGVHWEKKVLKGKIIWLEKTLRKGSYIEGNFNPEGKCT